MEREMREEWYYLHKDPTRVDHDQNVWELAFRLSIEKIVADLQRYARGEA